MSRIIPFERCLAPTFEAPAPRPIRQRPERELEPKLKTAAEPKPCGVVGCDGSHHHPVKLKAGPFGSRVPTRDSYCPNNPWFQYWKETL